MCGEGNDTYIQVQLNLEFGGEVVQEAAGHLFPRPGMSLCTGGHTGTGV